MIALQIYCTVGNEEQASHLANTFGITSNHILKFTNLSFVNEIKIATHDRGVDIVLTNSTADLLGDSLRSLANGGKVSLVVQSRNVYQG